MRKTTLWMTIPVATAALIALAGCGGPNSASQGSAVQTPSITVEQQTQTTNNVTGSTQPKNMNGSTAENSQAKVNEVIRAVRSQLKMKDVPLPTSFPLGKGKYLGVATTSNTSDTFSLDFYSTTKPVSINDKYLTTSGKKLRKLATYKVTTYSNPDQAGIFPETDLTNIPKDMSVDLGHGIRGISEGAAGSQYLTWKEGRWTLQIRSISEDNMNNPGIANKMVEYLETHTLPIPKDKGYVHVDYASGGKTVQVTISWQEGQRVYQLQTDQVPLEALRMAVSMKYRN